MIKYQSCFLVGFSAYLQSQFSNSMHFVAFSNELERVATSGDPLGKWYKRKLQSLYRSEAVYALSCSGKSLSPLSPLSLSLLFSSLALFWLVVIIIITIIVAMNILL